RKTLPELAEYGRFAFRSICPNGLRSGQGRAWGKPTDGNAWWLAIDSEPSYVRVAANPEIIADDINVALPAAALVLLGPETDPSKALLYGHIVAGFQDIVHHFLSQAIDPSNVMCILGGYPRRVAGLHCWMSNNLFNSSCGRLSMIFVRPMTPKLQNSCFTRGLDANTKPSNDVVSLSKSLETSTLYSSSLSLVTMPL